MSRCLNVQKARWTLILGCILQLDPNGFTAADGGANQLSDGVSHVQAWGTEAIMTFMLVFVVFAATDSQRSAGTPHLPVMSLLLFIVLIPVYV